MSGQTCDDALAETRQCSDQPCPAKDCKLSALVWYSFLLLLFLSIFRNWTSQKGFSTNRFGWNWGQWSAWSPCTRSSLQKTRRREVLTPPEGVGMPCNISLVEARILHFKSLKQTWSMKLSHVFFFKKKIFMVCTYLQLLAGSVERLDDVLQLFGS